MRFTNNEVTNKFDMVSMTIINFIEAELIRKE